MHSFIYIYIYINMLAPQKVYFWCSFDMHDQTHCIYTWFDSCIVIVNDL